MAAPRAGPPTQHQDLPQVTPPASASALAVRLTRLTQAVTETQSRALGLALDLGAISAELDTLRTGVVELAMREPGPEPSPFVWPEFYDGPPRYVRLANDGVVSASEHRGPSGPRPRPVAVVIGAEPWLFAGVVL